MLINQKRLTEKVRRDLKAASTSALGGHANYRALAREVRPLMKTVSKESSLYRSYKTKLWFAKGVLDLQHDLVVMSYYF